MVKLQLFKNSDHLDHFRPKWGGWGVRALRGTSTLESTVERRMVRVSVERYFLWIKSVKWTRANYQNEKDSSGIQIVWWGEHGYWYSFIQSFHNLCAIVFHLSKHVRWSLIRHIVNETLSVLRFTVLCFPSFAIPVERRCFSPNSLLPLWSVRIYFPAAIGNLDVSLDLSFRKSVCGEYVFHAYKDEIHSNIHLWKADVESALGKGNQFYCRTRNVSFSMESVSTMAVWPFGSNLWYPECQTNLYG